MTTFAQFIGFQWDGANRDKNWRAHGVGWWECEEAFFNQPLYVHEDQSHSTVENRWYVLGQTNAGRRLFLVFTRRGDTIRVISARDMKRKERKVYDEKAKTNS